MTLINDMTQEYIFQRAPKTYLETNRLEADCTKYANLIFDSINRK